MKVVQDAVNEARRTVYGSMSEQINLLTEDVPVGAKELEFELAVTGITPGMILSSGMNVWWVKEVSAASNVVYVVPGFDGSVPAAAKAGDVVFIKPRVTDWHLFNIVADVIAQMSSPTYGLHRVGEFTVRGGNTLTVPDTVTDIGDILAVSVREGRGSNRWYDMPTRTWRWMPDQRSIKILRDVPHRDVKVTYKAPFKRPEGLWWDMTTMCGLAESMLDIPALGAAASLLRTTEARRGQVSVQGDPRRADEVQAGSNSGAARDVQRQFQSRINDEYTRLVARNPIFIGV